MLPDDDPALSAKALRAVFDAVRPWTVGIEEEVLLLDPDTLLPKPCAASVLARAGGDGRLKPELPAAQVELLTRPHPSVAAAIDELAGAREALVAACGDEARPAAAALHPTASGPMALAAGERYDLTDRLHRGAARRQLVGAFQVHVAVGGADRTLAVYNALRGLLPELAALAAAAPFYEGADTGLASARPLVSALLPRQGIPPSIASWEAFAAELAWGRRSGALPDPARWWYELRPHLTHGTLELRVPDAQPSLAHARAVAEACVAVVRRLSDRFDAGEELPDVPRWRIAENRWAALRVRARRPDDGRTAPRPRAAARAPRRQRADRAQRGDRAARSGRGRRRAMARRPLHAPRMKGWKRLRSGFPRSPSRSPRRPLPRRPSP